MQVFVPLSLHASFPKLHDFANEALLNRFSENTVARQTCHQVTMRYAKIVILQAQG